MSFSLKFSKLYKKSKEWKQQTQRFSEFAFLFSSTQFHFRFTNSSSSTDRIVVVGNDGIEGVGNTVQREEEDYVGVRRRGPEEMLGGEQRRLRQVPVADRGLQIFMFFEETKSISWIRTVDHQSTAVSCSSPILVSKFFCNLRWNFECFW